MYNPPSATEGFEIDYTALYILALCQVAIYLQRIYVAYQPSTEAAQFAFIIWIIETIFSVTAYILFTSFIYLASSSTTAPKIYQAEIVSTQQDSLSNPQVRESTFAPELTLFDVLKGDVKSWVETAFKLLSGFALWTILHWRRQLDQEIELRQDQQGHYLLTANNELPTPVASALTVEGFKSETEIRRLRSRVPTWPRLIAGICFLMAIKGGASRFSSLIQLKAPNVEYIEQIVQLIQGFSGLFIIYRKNLVQTRWFFYFSCITSIYTGLVSSRKIWNADMRYGDFLANENTKELSDEALTFTRAISIIMVNVSVAGELWVIWRLVVDLKARDARLAKMK
ncbi:hypothetical protein FBU30_009370 [Linnemannia zychae]|nr:hypothetical protein FBU30_009370 [Linnemannia zychae]